MGSAHGGMEPCMGRPSIAARNLHTHVFPCLVMQSFFCNIKQERFKILQQNPEVILRTFTTIFIIIQSAGYTLNDLHVAFNANCLPHHND